MTTERTALHQRLTEVLGVDQALTLMSLLPAAAPATRDDLAGIEARLSARFDAVEQRLTGLEQRIDRIETRLDLHEVRFDNIHEALRQQTRNFIFATTGSMISLAILAFGAAALI
jgi:hypothetical protein